YCLAHEWSHVERRDIVSWHLATLTQFLFFYQPLFWWLRRQLRLCQDYLADARAAEQAVLAEDYADYLVGLARPRLRAPLRGALARRPPPAPPCTGEPSSPQPPATLWAAAAAAFGPGRSRCPLLCCPSLSPPSASTPARATRRSRRRTLPRMPGRASRFPTPA